MSKNITEIIMFIGKAARDMMMRVVGEEEENIRTLSYAPGPLPTDMMDKVISESKDQDFVKQVKGKFHHTTHSILMYIRSKISQRDDDESHCSRRARH